MEEQMTITYEVNSTTYKDKSLYVNMTNRCNNRCTFCHRFNRENPKNAYDFLWLKQEPTLEEVRTSIFQRDLSVYEKLVFCGYGEPTYRIEDILIIAKEVKEKTHLKIRINTNGLAASIYGEDITPKLSGVIDEVSISLNAKTAEKYDAICMPTIDNAFEVMLNFAKRASKFTKVYMTIIDFLSDEDKNACKKIAESVGAELKIRKYLN